MAKIKFKEGDVVIMTGYSKSKRTQGGENEVFEWYMRNPSTIIELNSPTIAELSEEPKSGESYYVELSDLQHYRGNMLTNKFMNLTINAIVNQIGVDFPTCAEAKRLTRQLIKHIESSTSKKDFDIITKLKDGGVDRAALLTKLKKIKSSDGWSYFEKQGWYTKASKPYIKSHLKATYEWLGYYADWSDAEDADDFVEDIVNSKSSYIRMNIAGTDCLLIVNGKQQKASINLIK